MDKIYAYCLLFVLCSCSSNIVEENTSSNVFDVFWQIMDERYVFFEERNINWDSIYTEFKPRFENATDEQMKDYFGKIIDYIGDRHVSIACDKSSSISIKTERLVWQNMLSSYFNMTNEKYIKPISFCQLNDSILYLWINSFKHPIDVNVLKNAIAEYNYDGGIILDLRENGGGDLNQAINLLSLFVGAERTAWYKKDKTGRTHDDFSNFKAISFFGANIIPNKTQKVLMCNNGTYSSGNLFASGMKDITENCTLIGEQSGGGAGAPLVYSLPNGWVLYCTAQKYYNTQKQTLEFGVLSDINVPVSEEFWNEVHRNTGEDPQLQKALNYLEEIGNL